MILRRVNTAYLYMLELIDKGVEYPDAEWRAASRFNVPSKDLREMYDGEQINHAEAYARQHKDQQ